MKSIIVKTGIAKINQSAMTSGLSNKTALESISKRFADSIQKVSLNSPDRVKNEQILALSGLLSLAARGLLPGPASNLKRRTGLLIEKLALDLFGIENLTEDQNDFACLAALPGMNDLDACLDDRLFEQEFTKAEGILIADPLFSGWIYQSLTDDRADYTSLRESRDPEKLASITQWFTPSWIADFLIEDLFKKSGGSRLDCSKSTFLDPACGAGHLMIPALNRLIGAASLGQNDCRNRLVKVLKEQLFGFDLDPHMVRLTGFSLYLHCRDLAGVTPLPIPQIYSFDAPADFNFGSLSLGVDPDQQANRLVDDNVVAHDRAGCVDPDQQAHRLVDPRGAKKSARDLPLRFDFIAANPPYLSHRLMPKALGAYLKKFYPGCHFDLYAAFLELSMRLLNNNGCASLICQQSFLSINRYESLRRRILKDCSLKTVIQLGPGSFAARGGEKVNNAIITFRKHCQKQSSPVRTLKLLATKEKERARESGIDNLRFESIESERIKKLAESIPGYPISCFCPDEIARLFDKYQALESKDSGVVLTNGLFTCNNRLFVKRFFEIEKQDESIYVPYDKGGGRKWFANTPYRLAWQNDGEEIRAYRKSRGQSESLPGESYYFKQGLTYSYIGTRGFTARLIAPGSVFDIASSALFTSRIDLNYLLGWLNSKLIRFVLGVLNPTINFQIGDLRRLPLIIPSRQVEIGVAALTEQAIELARQADSFLKTSPAYLKPPLSRYLESTGVYRQDVLTRGYNKMIEAIITINSAERSIQKEIDEIIFDLYKISQATRKVILADAWVVRNDSELIEIPSLLRAVKELGI